MISTDFDVFFPHPVMKNMTTVGKPWVRWVETFMGPVNGFCSPDHQRVPKTRQITERRYKSSMADQICYAVLCVFSYIAAGQEQRRSSQQIDPQQQQYLQPSSALSVQSSPRRQ
ncbi:hypothetical protein RUM43_012327 [Polyplax serrata]|uniref:MAP kinase-activating death domain-containing protein n=1 Tax=Polyplax serrata TaxID=468196 RepID=A0AAN8RZB7_POLSC